MRWRPPRSAKRRGPEIYGQDYIDVIGATSVTELADVITAILGARTEMRREPGRITVTPTADRDRHVSLEFGPIDDTARKAPDLWPRRITITHQRGAEDCRRWTHHTYDSIADRRSWELTLSSGDQPDSPAPNASDSTAPRALSHKDARAPHVGLPIAGAVTPQGHRRQRTKCDPVGYRIIRDWAASILDGTEGVLGITYRACDDADRFSVVMTINPAPVWGSAI
ncbi:hypothetical protein ACWEK5_46555 [Rhodococcus koreensis]